MYIHHSCCFSRVASRRALAIAASIALFAGVARAQPTPAPSDGESPIGLKLNDHPEPARTKGWVKKGLPGKQQVKIESGHRNHIFYVGQPVSFKLTGPASTYEVRNYDGELIEQGPAGDSITLKQTKPGWYKLYIYGTEKTPEWGDIVGGTMFVIFRNDPRFPENPAPDVGAHSPYYVDEVARGLIGIGPQRHAADRAENPDATIKKLQSDIELDKQFYLPFDPLRQRALMIAFPNGTKGKLDGVKKIAEHYKDVVKYYEPRNEPNGGSNGTNFAINEMKPFYDTIKSVDPSLKVMGPGTVSVGPPGHMLQWIDDFFKAGGGDSIDVFSFHIYNGVNGDLFMGRKTMDTLEALLKKNNADKKEKWQTEQGFMACVYGAYQPHLQARWTMLMYMLFEQYGIPKEHSHYFYDLSHGFWDFPTWFENGDRSLNPIAPLMRIWSEELYGKQFVERYDFGAPGNNLYIGSRFAGPDGQVAAFQSAGSTKGSVNLSVTGGDTLHLVSAFGEESDLPVQNGKAMLPVGLLPVYVELAKAQAIKVIPTDWGDNLARQPGVGAEASKAAKPEKPGKEVKPDDISKLTNGDFENWYYAQGKSPGPWKLDPESWPATVTLTLPSTQSISRVLVYAAPPWQGQGTLLNYELQYDNNGQWTTLDRIQEPSRTFGVYSPALRTTVDSFSSDRWIFQSHFTPVTTSKIRLVIHDATWGGGASKIVGEAGGQAGVHAITLREIEVYPR